MQNTYHHYVSGIVNPWREDNDITQEDYIEIGEKQFLMDSIPMSIGTEICKTNIDLHLKDVLDTSTNDEFNVFYNDCLVKLIEVYGLWNLEDFTKLPLNINRKKEISSLLKFFEQGECSEFIVQMFNPEHSIFFAVSSREQIIEYLELRYGSFMDSLKNHASLLPQLVYYFFKLSPSENAIFCLLKLITNNKTEITSKYLINRGIDHVDY